MRHLSFFWLLGFMLFVACGNQSGSPKEEVLAEVEVEAEPTLPLTTIKFKTIKHRFGKVKEGEKVSFDFEFENTGNTNLLLQQVRASCGCTTPSYDQKPILPGEKGIVTVAFDTKGRPGKQRKGVSVVANTEPETTTLLTFSCDVIPEETEK